jgi:hypothetical protein
MTNQFCKDVLKVLESKYSDAYEINLELTQNRFTNNVELKIKSGRFTLRINNDYMHYLFELYRTNVCLPENNQPKWQKELSDLIES